MGQFASDRRDRVLEREIFSRGPRPWSLQRAPDTSFSKFYEEATPDARLLSQYVQKPVTPVAGAFPHAPGSGWRQRLPPATLLLQLEISPPCNLQLRPARAAGSRQPVTRLREAGRQALLPLGGQPCAHGDAAAGWCRLGHSGCCTAKCGYLCPAVRNQTCTQSQCSRCLGCSKPAVCRELIWLLAATS